MLRNKKSSSYKNRSTNITNVKNVTNKKSPKLKNNNKFMKKSNISPRFQITDFDESNLLKSPAPVAPQVLNSHENPYIPISSSPSIAYQDRYQDPKPIEIEDDNNDDDEYYENSDSYDEYDSDDGINTDTANDSYATSIKNKDMRIFKMKIMLEEKRKQMFEKEREVRELQQNNSFLETVISDYEKYNKAILEEKNKQKKAIQILSEHIRDISREIKNDDYKLGRVKNDQYMLLEELKNIQNEMKEALSLNGSKNEYTSTDEQKYDSYSDHNSYFD